MDSNNNQVNKRCCIKCGKEVKKLAKGKCNSCYLKEYSYNLHINSPLIKCECKPECQVMIHSIGPSGKPSKYALYHSVRGENHQSWKGGRVKQYGYWLIWCPNHPNARKIGYVSEHVYNFTQFNKCCMLPWGIVHHLDENKENNMPWNLQGMVNKIHGKHHNPKTDMSGRECSICGSIKTTIDKKGPHWLKDGKGGFWCKICGDRQYKKRKKLENINKNVSSYI